MPRPESFSHPFDSLAPTAVFNLGMLAFAGDPMIGQMHDTSRAVLREMGGRPPALFEAEIHGPDAELRYRLVRSHLSENGALQPFALVSRLSPRGYYRGSPHTPYVDLNPPGIAELQRLTLARMGLDSPERENPHWRRLSGDPLNAAAVLEAAKRELDSRRPACVILEGPMTYCTPQEKLALLGAGRAVVDRFGGTIITELPIQDTINENDTMLATRTSAMTRRRVAEGRFPSLEAAKQLLGEVGLKVAGFKAYGPTIDATLRSIRATEATVEAVRVRNRQHGMYVLGLA